MGNDINAQVEPRFGRCPYFIIIETETMDVQAFDNKNIDLQSGAGIQTASFIASQGVEAILTGNCGPKAMQVLNEAGINVFTGQSGTIMEAVQRYKNNLLTSTITATVPEKQGVQNSGTSEQLTPQANKNMGGGKGTGGCGGGRGMGGGGGRGMGGGGGRGMGGGGGRGMGGGGRKQ